MNAARRFAVSLFALVAGCMPAPTDMTPTCSPDCAAGYHCTDTGCVPDAPGADMMAADLAATCTPACSGQTPKCNANHHCVVCLVDADCPIGNVCKTLGDTASCAPGCSDDSRCPMGQKCCNAQCIDTTSDAMNCGSCGKSCGAIHSTATCSNGACMAGQCYPGWGDCNNDPSDGCETNTHIDPKNCGGCGMACTFQWGIAACADTCYLAACQFGYADCNNDPKDGCETSVLSDVRNCGGCGTPCANLPNATSACISATCTLTKCNAGFADCNNNAQDGCEQRIDNDTNNCGKCGNVCPQGQICVNGGCTCQNCANALPHAQTTCQNGQCIFQGCAPGYGDCNNNQADGCEANLSSDTNNCNACGTVCPQGQLCANGTCQSCGNDCWGPAGCLTNGGHCIRFTCRAGSAGANFCNPCMGWRDVTYDQWMHQGYCSDVIAKYRQSDGTATHCGGGGMTCCMGKANCGGGDNAWHFWNAQAGQNYYTGPCLGCQNDTNCMYWNNPDNSGYTRLTICER